MTKEEIVIEVDNNVIEKVSSCVYLEQEIILGKENRGKEIKRRTKLATSLWKTEHHNYEKTNKNTFMHHSGNVL